ncbi:MAG: glycosyltransferase involved in cell wall biosynthesis [Vicingaceae bacterium]
MEIPLFTLGKHKELSVAFIHGRPSGHPTHAKYAKSVGSTFFHEDRLLHWQDREASKLKRYASWILNAFFFPNRKKWDVVLTECVRIPQLIQKKIGLLNKRQKLIALMSDESLYFTVSKKFPRLTQFLMVQFWKSCDALICIGSFQVDLAKEILPQSHHHKIYQTFNGIPEAQMQRLNLVTPALDSKTIIFIGNASAIWRTEYKGLDIMIETLLACLEETELIFKIAGNIPLEIQSYLLKNVPEKRKGNIQFLGIVENLDDLFSEACLYLHTARGEAWGISINEALAAGVPAIVSDKTGSKKLVNMVAPNFVVSLEKEAIKNSILNYLVTLPAEKEKISKKAKEISKQYREEDAITNFKTVFYTVLEEIK